MLTSIIGQARDSFARESGMQMADVWQKRFAKHAGDARPPTRASANATRRPVDARPVDARPVPSSKHVPSEKASKGPPVPADIKKHSEPRTVQFASSGREVTFNKASAKQ